MRLLPFVLLFAACSNPVALQDQYDQSIGPLFSAPEDGLSSPYQVGVSFEIELVGRDALVAELNLVSSDEEVLSVLQMRTETNEGSLRRFAQVQTMGAGTVDLEVRQGERRRHTATIDIMEPDRVALAPIQRLVALTGDDTPDQAPMVERMDVLVSSEAEFELRPMAGDQELTGAVSPTLDLPNGRAQAGQYRTDDEFDVVLISPGQGVATLTLTYPGQTFTADVEGHNEVGDVDLRCVEDESQADQFGGFACIATAETAAGQPLFGVFPAWNEVAEDGTTSPLDTDRLLPADILTYQVVNDSDAAGPEIRIDVAGLSDTERAFGPIDTFDLDNSNNVTACSVLSPYSLWLAGPALLLLGLRRRRD